MLRSRLFREILLAFVLLILFTAALTIVFSRQLLQLTQQDQSLTRRSFHILLQSENLRILCLQMGAMADEYLDTGDERPRQRYAQFRQSFKEGLAATRQLVSDSPEETALLAEAEKAFLAWERESVEPAFALRQKYPRERETTAELRELIRRGIRDSRYEKLRQLLRRFEDHELADSDAMHLEFEGRGRRLSFLTWTFLALASFLALAVGFFIAASVSRSVRSLVQGVQNISAGEYAEVPVEGDDEFAVLARAYNRMVAAVRERDLQLRGYVQQQQTQVESLSQTLEQQKSRFETVLNTIMDGVIMVDAEGKILMVNPKACEIFGIPNQEMTQLHLADLMERFRRLVVNPEELDGKISVLRSNPGTTAEVTFEFKDPSYGAIRLYSVPLYGADGSLLGRVATSLDISKEKEIDRLKREFISTVSHELRTPLTSIKGSLGLIAGGAVGEVTPDMRELLQIAQNNTERLIRLINDILDVFKIESGRIRLRPAPISLGDCIQRALAATEPYADKTRIRVEAEIPDDLPPVLADAQRVDQVLINLLSNAIKFSPPGEAVTVSARVTVASHGESSAQEGRPWVEVAIQDRGKGIPEPFLQRIFNKFEQVDSSATREHGGTGLGLTISRAIIEQHGGKIWVESQMGVGSTFYFTLPVLDEGRTRETPVAAVSERGTSNPSGELHGHKESPVS